MRPTSFTFSRGGIRTRLTFLSGGVIFVQRTGRESFAENDSPSAVLREPFPAELSADGESTVFSSQNLSVCIRNGVLSFFDRKGQELLREPEARPCVLQEKPVMKNRFDPSAAVRTAKSIDGARAFAEPSESYQDRTAYEARQSFVFDEDEALYGLGSHEEGIGNLRGHSRILYQQNMKAVVPVLVSSKGWGILFDMGCLMSFHDDSEGSFLWADCADELRWYFFYGDGSYASLMREYRLLTGAAPMLPLYALGFIQSKERYTDAGELLSVAREYRRRGIPLDMVVQDWQTWPEGQWGFKHFDETRFPDPEGLTDALHGMDVKMMISIWPSMSGERNDDREEMLQNGFMLGNRLIYNAFDEAARALYWKQANEGLFRFGVDAWWCDCTEPFESDWHGQIRPDPVIRTVLNTEEAKRYLDPAEICLFSRYHSEGIYRGQRAATDSKRVLNLTRSSWAGQHRYGTVTWSGDVSATWETLKRHIPEGLNFCASGEGNWSTDIGGFFPGRSELWFIDGDYDQGMADPGYRELFVRWAQYAAFLPMMRAHGSVTPREIWRLGEAGELFYDAMAETIRLRYRLIPYLYTLSAELCFEGLPWLRHPALEFPGDPVLRGIDSEMMVGDALLVKPVTRPMYDRAGGMPVSSEPDFTEEIYLPAGHRWSFFYTGECFEGGQTVSVSVPLDRLPLFVRAGSILPLGSDAESTKAQKKLPLTISVCPGEDGAFVLYEDAGDGYGYEKGEYAGIPFTWHDAEQTLTVGARQGSYPGMEKERLFLIRAGGSARRELLYTGERTEIRM